MERPTARIEFAGVLGVVEHQDVAGGGLGGDDARVLGHVPEKCEEYDRLFERKHNLKKHRSDDA